MKSVLFSFWSSGEGCCLDSRAPGSRPLLNSVMKIRALTGNDVGIMLWFCSDMCEEGVEERALWCSSVECDE